MANARPPHASAQVKSSSLLDRPEDISFQANFGGTSLAGDKERQEEGGVGLQSPTG